MKIQIPEDLSKLSVEELNALHEQIVEASAELLSIDGDQITDEQLAEIEELAEASEKVTGRVEEIAAEVQAKADRLAAARAKLEAPEVEEPVEEVEEEVVEEIEIPDDVSKLLEPVTASAKPKAPSVRQIARRSPRPEVPVAPAREHVTITAMADVPGFASGSVMSGGVADLAEAAIARAKSLPRGAKGKYTQLPVAKIQRPETEFSTRNYKSGDGLIDAVTNEQRLVGADGRKGLTAAGGWCAPSEVLYDLCELESTEGLIDLPRISVDRGGIQFTKGFQFPDFAGAGFTQTEAQAEIGTEKVCIDIECPEFEEERLDAIGVCVSAPLLTRAAYPELIARYIRGVMIAHEHYVSAYIIGRLRSILGSAVSVANVWPTAVSILTALELVAEGERQRYRLPFNATLEVLLPSWIKAAIRADLSIRTGVDLINVTDAVIESYFSNRKLRVQFLYNFQDLTITGGSPAGPVPATDFPDTVEAIMYPAGTFVVGSTDVIDLDTIYDSTKLSTNEYTALFTEEGILVANTCADGRRLSIPLNVSGLTAAALINQDWGSTPPLVADESL